MNVLQNIVLSTTILLSSTSIVDANHFRSFWKESIYDHLNPEISIVFAGDTMMDWSIKDTVKTKGPDYPFRYVKEEIEESDYAVVNLETAVTNHTGVFSKEYYFKSDPIALRVLKKLGLTLFLLLTTTRWITRQKGCLIQCTTFIHMKCLI